MNPADTYWHPAWDRMEYQRQLKIAARQLQEQYGGDYAKRRAEYDAWCGTPGELELLAVVQEMGNAKD